MSPAHPDTDHALATRYLLGELPESERDTFEDRLFTDESLHELVSATEDELIEAFLADELPASSRDAFQRSIDEDPRRRERVRLMKSIAAATEKAAAEKAPATAPKRRWFPWILAPLLAACGVVVLALWLVRDRPGPTDPDGPMLAVALPQPTRSSTAIELRRADVKARVRLEPELAALTPGATLEMVLRRRGTAIAGTVVRDPRPGFEVAGSALTPGLYVLEVTAGGASAGMFELRVVE